MFLLQKKAMLLLSLGIGMNGVALAEDNQADFFNQLKNICGHSYEGELVTFNASDEEWRQSQIVIHAPACQADMTSQIKIPLHVGQDKSRTWIISKVKTGLKLKHDHRHKDGTPDAVSMYGGHTVLKGTALEQHFPVDDFSKELFRKEGLTASLTNVWTISLVPGQTLSYALSRPGREFKLTFDLTRPIPSD